MVFVINFLYFFPPFLKKSKNGLNHAGQSAIALKESDVKSKKYQKISTVIVRATATLEIFSNPH
jgi:hypothetical protein